VALLKTLVYGTAGYFLLSRVSLPLAFMFCAAVAMYYAKDSLDLIRF
jgi:hypothetical protein